MQHQTTSNHATPRHATPRHATPRHTNPRFTSYLTTTPQGWSTRQLTFGEGSRAASLLDWPNSDDGARVPLRAQKGSHMQVYYSVFSSGR